MNRRDVAIKSAEKEAERITAAVNRLEERRKAEPARFFGVTARDLHDLVVLDRDATDDDILTAVETLAKSRPARE